MFKSTDLIHLTTLHVARIRAEYDAEVKDWYENGDGRPRNYVTEVSCANCGVGLTIGKAPFQNEGAWYASGPNGRFCPDVDGQDHEPAFHQVNIGGEGYRFPVCIHGASLWVDHDIPCGQCEGDDRTDEEVAIEMAESIASTVNERQAWFSYRPSGMSSEQATALIDWVFEPLKQIQPKKEN